MKILLKKVFPEWSEIKHKQRVLAVEFPNCISTKTGEPFQWLPTYRELTAIFVQLVEIEKENESVRISE